MTADEGEVGCEVVDLQTGFEGAPGRYAVVLHEGADPREAEVVPGPEGAARRAVFRRG
jgi:hypothetical protein